VFELWLHQRFSNRLLSEPPQPTGRPVLPGILDHQLNVRRGPCDERFRKELAQTILGPEAGKVLRLSAILRLRRLGDYNDVALSGDFLVAYPNFCLGTQGKRSICYTDDDSS